MGSRGSASRRSGSAAKEIVPPPDPGWARELALADVGLVARLMRLDLLVSRVLDEITSAEGVSPSDYVVLGVLRRSPGHASSPTRLCEVLGRSTGGMTLTIDRLEAAGWCTRAADPEDRRRVVVTLTERGLGICTRVNDALHAWEDALGLDAHKRAEAIRMVDHLLGLFEAREEKR